MTKKLKIMLSLNVVPQEKLIAAALAEYDDVVLTTVHKDTGDVDCVDLGIGWEVKSTGDLVSSFVGSKDKKPPRLQEQLTRMLTIYAEPILLVWDWFEPTHSNYIMTNGRLRFINWDALWNSLLFWQRRGILIDLAASREHAARRIVLTARNRAEAQRAA